MPAQTFVAIFDTPTYDGEPFTIVDKPVKIEFFRAIRDFKIVQQLTRVATAPREGEMQLAGDATIRTSADRYSLVIWARVNNSNQMRDEANALLDLTMAKLSAIYGDYMFCNQVYRGPLFESGGNGAASMQISIAPSMVAIDGASTETALASVHKYLLTHKDSASRLKIAAKMFAKAMFVSGLEESFLLRWIILEIHPMGDSTNIRGLRKWVAERTGKSEDEVNQKLEIGRLHGYRSDLVHNGKMADGPKGHQITDIVLQMSREAIIDLCGQPYGGHLDRLLK